MITHAWKASSILVERVGTQPAQCIIGEIEFVAEMMAKFWIRKVNRHFECIENDCGHVKWDHG